MLRKLFVFALTTGLAAKVYRDYRERHATRTGTDKSDATPPPESPAEAPRPTPLPPSAAGYTNGAGVHVH